VDENTNLKKDEKDSDLTAVNASSVSKNNLTSKLNEFDRAKTNTEYSKITKTTRTMNTKAYTD
jgi:hypothetical protein